MSDEKLNAAYSALPREEPGAAIDAAILAASRRALAKPSALRWAGPMSIAAVLVLAFGVTLNMQQEKGPVESPDMYGAPPPAASTEPVAAAPVPPEIKALDRAADPARRSSEIFTQLPTGKKKIAPPAKPDRNETRAYQERDRVLRDEKPAVAEESERKDLAPAPQAKLQAAPAPEPLAKESGNVRQAPAPAAPPASVAAAPAPAIGALRMKREAAAADTQAIDEPTRELEAIAKLRAEGKHEQADKAVAEFRRKRPEYRIPDAMWERVKPR